MLRDCAAARTTPAPAPASHQPPILDIARGLTRAHEEPVHARTEVGDRLRAHGAELPELTRNPIVIGALQRRVHRVRVGRMESPSAATVVRFRRCVKPATAAPALSPQPTSSSCAATKSSCSFSPTRSDAGLAP